MSNLIDDKKYQLPLQMPAQKPGKSKQNYGTPKSFISVVEKRFGSIACDLAAEEKNAKALKFYDEQSNSLIQPWSEHYPVGNLWLNPPFRNIHLWAKKCHLESQNRQGLILLLTPASIGTVWFRDFIHQKAMVLGLSPRIIFEGETAPFPKDLMLSIFGMGMSGFDVWRWTD